MTQVKNYLSLIKFSLTIFCLCDDRLFLAVGDHSVVPGWHNVILFCGLESSLVTDDMIIKFCLVGCMIFARSAHGF